MAAALVKRDPFLMVAATRQHQTGPRAFEAMKKSFARGLAPREGIAL
jgi:hypothetical protein